MQHLQQQETVTALPTSPVPENYRWNINGKRQVVQAVLIGDLTLHAACDQYNLSTEEFLSWQQEVQN